jgi:hypothetical protein
MRGREGWPARVASSSILQRGRRKEKRRRRNWGVWLKFI